jgi:hypothetical protein
VVEIGGDKYGGGSGHFFVDSRSHVWLLVGGTIKSGVSIAELICVNLLKIYPSQNVVNF